MAQKIKDGESTIVVLDRQEAVDLVSLLVGQLANRPALNSQCGMMPEINIQNGERFAFMVK